MANPPQHLRSYLKTDLLVLRWVFLGLYIAITGLLFADVCGYDIRASAHQCPECGTPFN